MHLFRSLEQWGRERALGALARGISTPRVTAQQAGETLRKNSSPKILFIGLFQNMGQFLCATPLIRSFKAGWPQGSLHFLGNPVNAPVARLNPHFDRVWVWKKSAFWEWPVLLRMLRKERFDLALLLTTERPSATAVFLARASGVRWLAGYVPSVAGAWAQEASGLCHIQIPFAGEKNEVEKFLGFARAFGIPAKGHQPELVPAPTDAAAADAFLAAQNFASKGPLVGLFIGGKAERSDRLWPVPHFAALADMLKSKGFRVMVLSPPPPEHQRLEEFRRTLSWTCPVYQEPSLGRVAAFLRKLDLLVCPDGGILHVAAAVGTPTLGLFFSTDPEVWRHDLPQTFLNGREKPSSLMLPETVVHEAIRFLGVSTPS
jgi:ADP-heptose:LPS heptosyltransferase